MKIVTVMAVCVGIAAAIPALAIAQTSSSSSSTSLAATAPPRDVVEANLKARMRIAQTTFAQAFEEMKAGDKVKGCADLRAGAEDLRVTDELITQDLELIKIDPSIDQATRDSLLAQGKDAQAKLNATRDKIAAFIQQQCS